VSSRSGVATLRTAIHLLLTYLLYAELCCWMQSLLLLTYLVRNGSERVVTSTREHIHDLRQLTDYTCYDEYGRDQGANGTLPFIDRVRNTCQNVCL